MKKSILRTVKQAVIAALACAGCSDNGVDTRSPYNSGLVDRFIGAAHTLTVTTNPSGSGSVSRNPNNANYGHGTPVTVTATAYSGYTFTGWSGAATSANASVTITMDGDKTLIANFADRCLANPTPDCPNYCSWYPNAAQCQPTDPCVINPYAQGCPGVVDYYCLWEVGCAKIQDPDALKTDCGYPPACPSGMTNKSYCVAYGKLFESLDACENYVPTEPEYYCYWQTGCVRIGNPNNINPDNPGMTEKEVCEAYGQLFTSQAACQAYVPPAVGYYCDYGPVETNPNGVIEDKGCWHINKVYPTAAVDCEFGTFIICTGSDRPSDGSCCAH